MSEPSITDIASFFGGLYALKCLKQGMDNGNLPKIVERYGKYVVKLIIENPEFMVYAGTGTLGFMAFEGELKTKLVGGVSGMMAYKMATGGGQIVGPLAAAYLAGLGFWWLLGNPVDIIQKELQDKTDPECVDEDGRINLDCVLRKLLGL